MVGGHLLGGQQAQLLRRAVGFRGLLLETRRQCLEVGNLALQILAQTQQVCYQGQ
jgi:hypothetical protein